MKNKTTGSLETKIVEQEDGTCLVLFQGKVIGEFASEKEATQEYSFANYVAFLSTKQKEAV